MHETDVVTTTAPDRPASGRRSALIAAGSLAATGMALSAAFFPLLFNRWESYDDEGMFLVSLRQLLKHGSLYTHIWADKYGPFYYLVMSTLYRVLHQQPTLANGRWIVLVLTTASAALLGGAVWRLTKNLPCSLLGEVAAFLILIEGAGNEPMHPGSLGVLLLAVVAFELSSYVMNPTNVHLFVIGVAAGALAMTKLNAGLLVLIAVAAAFLVGNSSVPRWIRILVASLAALAPIALVFQNLSSEGTADLAFLVAATVIGTAVVMSIDALPLAPLALVPVAIGAAAIGVVSFIFPLSTGTPLSSVFTGVFIRPLDQAAQLTRQPSVRVSWVMCLVTLAALGAVLVVRSRSQESVRAWSPWANAALTAAALWLLGIVGTIAARGYPVAEWLPALALLPALAFCSYAPEPMRFALRSFVLLAALQIMVAYPVAGTQVLWGTVLVTVPCAIAVAVGIERITVWTDASREARLFTTAFLCVVLIIASSQWPVAIWSGYVHSAAFDLPGTGLMRIDPGQQDAVKEVTQVLRSQCDTFYGVPDENSFYIFTGIRPFTGQLVDRPIALTLEQQRQVVRTLRQKTAAHQRVCLLRDSSHDEVIPRDLRTELRRYSKVVAQVGPYTISKHQ